MAIPCCTVTPVCKSCRLYPGCYTANFGLLSQYLSSLPCNSTVLTPYCNYRDFNQRFIRIHLLHTYQPSILLKELNSNANHQLISSPAALSGLLTMSVIVSEGPTFIVTVPSQGTHKSIATSGAGHGNNSYLLLSDIDRTRRINPIKSPAASAGLLPAASVDVRNK